ncbi:MAG TPA: branched-chain amino acid ABC transporter ATP-binding protein/permease [Candidatus Binatia bacterium]|nr:branched-chain amino acid ABC transporter ATP-binding protein/permease [Candidatus Binatia bacterium]
MTPAAAWLVVAAAAAVVPLLTANTYYLYLAMTIGILVVVAGGLNVLAGLTGQISLGHAGLYAIGAYTAALAATRLGLGFWTALPLAVVVTAIIGAAVALAALRLSGPYLAMVTIAFGIIVEGALVEWVALTGGPGGIFDIPKPRLAGVPLALSRYYWLVAAAAALALLLTRNLARSAWGRALVAVRDSELAAESLGLFAYRVRTTAFTLSAAFAGAGGALFAFLNGYLSPDSFTLQTSILFLLTVLFGGLGTVAGPLVGAVALVLLPELMHQFVEYRLILYGSLLLLSVYFLPRGVVGALARRRGVGSAAAGAAAAGGSPGPRPGRGPGPPPATAAPAAAGPRGGDFVERAHRPEHTEAGGGPAVLHSVVLQLTGVTKSFGGVRALDGVTLAVRAGTIHSLIGPNGAGKTTLVNLVSGFDRPDGGTIELFGEPVGGRSAVRIARRGLARTFQTPQLFEELAVLDNVLVAATGPRLGWLAAALAGAGGDAAATRARADDALAAVGLGEWAATPAADLPFGHRRRLEIARALAAGARVLMLDEPAAGLAPAEIEALDALLSRLRAAGLTVVLIEHHVELVMAISDRVTVLDEGRVIAEGAPAAVQRDPAVLAAYLGTPA